MVMKEMTFTNKASQITSLKEKWATLNSTEIASQWFHMGWKVIEKRVNKLQSRITRAELKHAANTNWLMNCLSGVR
jgi:hypothetical protein